MSGENYQQKCFLSVGDCRLDLCFVEGLSHVGDIWRFLPVFDPGVSVMVSRDMDSLLTSREAQAVTQWLEETSLPFHVMRQ